MTITSFKTLILREYWENRSFLIAPAIIAAVLVFSVMVLLITAQNLDLNIFQDLHLEGDLSFSALNGMEQLELERAWRIVLLGLVMLPMLTGVFFVLFFYVLGSLYNDRRDRSILFWKSMPVSDLQTVLSKVFSAFIVIPMITWGIAVLTQFLIMCMITITVWINGGAAWELVWAPSAIFKVVLYDFAYLLLLALWMAPVAGWLWFVSAVVKKGPFLVAVFVPLGIMFIEALIFHSRHFASLIMERLIGFFHAVERSIESGSPFSFMQQDGFWSGLLVCAVFVAIAIYIRRYRDDSY